MKDRRCSIMCNRKGYCWIFTNTSTQKMLSCVGHSHEVCSECCYASSCDAKDTYCRLAPRSRHQ